MHKPLFRSALIGACLALLAGSAVAKDHGRDRDRDDRGRARFEHRDNRRGWGDRDHRFRYASDRSRERERARAREHAREREHARIAAERSRRPPGWSKGKKTGWGDCDVPPGQAKKVGCQPVHHAGYPRRDGRRPVIAGRRPASNGSTMHQVLNNPQSKPSSGATMHQVLNKPQTKPSNGQTMHEVLNGKPSDKR